MLNFDFSEKGLELVSPLQFLYDFSRKIFLILHSINWPNIIVWLPLLLKILGNMCITIVFLTKLWRHKFEFDLIFFIIFSCQNKNCPRPESAPLSTLGIGGKNNMILESFLDSKLAWN